MHNIPENRFQEFIAAARQIAAHNLVICSSGNLSWRITNDLLIITTTDSWMARLSRQDIAPCRIADCSTVEETEPSKEIGFHAGIFRERPNINVVLHFNSPCATAISCCDQPSDDFSVIPEVPYYIGPVGSVPFLTPGSTELAQAVTAAMRDHDLVMLGNHGQVVVAKNLDNAIAKAAYFELACKIILAAPGRVRPMPPENITELRRQGREHRAKST